MPHLNIPIPVLKPGNEINSYTQVEEPVEVKCGPVTFPDGSTVDIFKVTKFGFYVFKEDSGQEGKIWDKNAELWRVESVVREEDREFNLLGLDEQDVANPWKGIFLALGKKYPSTEESSGFPQYFVKCYFEAKDSSDTVHSGLSNSSNKIKLSKVGSDYKAGLMIDDLSDPRSAQWVHMFLKDSNRKLIGEVKLKTENGVGGIELVNYDGNSSRLSYIHMDKDGEIELVGKYSEPAKKTSIKLTKEGDIIIDAAKVTVKGSLEVEDEFRVDNRKWYVGIVDCAHSAHSHDNLIKAL